MLAAILPILPTVIQVLGGLGTSFFAGDADKIQKIVNIASHALGGVTYAVVAFERIRDRLGGNPIEQGDYDALIAEIDANSATIGTLHQQAVDRDAADDA